VLIALRAARAADVRAAITGAWRTVAEAGLRKRPRRAKKPTAG
jgi:hypothetical protein